MSDDFLSTCRERAVEAQKRFLQAQTTLQKAQQDFAQAQLEFGNWQGVVNAETRRLALLQHAAQINQSVLPITPSPQPKPEAAAPVSPTTSTTPQASNEINKTELVRELLMQHPEGMTPVEVWNVLKNQIARPYVYSILKRLKDADEALYQKKRKKYSLRVIQKTEEASKEPTLVH